MRPLALAALALFGCPEPVPAEYAAILPDDRLLVDLPSRAERDAGDSEYYGITAAVTGQIDAFLGGVLHTLDEATALPPTWASDEAHTAVWGPYAGPLDPVETRLVVSREVPADAWSWMVHQRPKGGAEDEWVTVVAGQVEAGASASASRGWFVVDFSAVHVLDPSQTATGAFGTEYVLDGDAAQATAAFDDFAVGGAPLDAWYRYDQVVEGPGSMDLAFLHDLNGNGTLEEYLLRSRWLPTGAGRADGRVTGGDLGPLVATVSECWDATFATVFHDDNFTGDSPTGDAAACAFPEPEYAEG